MDVKRSKIRLTIMGLFAFLTLSLLALSCSTATSEVAQSAPIKTDTIDISDFKFVPDSIEVPADTTVKWRNNDNVIHTILSDTNLFQSNPLPADGNYSYTFSEKGTFTYYCLDHPFMKGKITVK